jgi:hypothetical protein
MLGWNVSGTDSHVVIIDGYKGSLPIHEYKQVQGAEVGTYSYQLAPWPLWYTGYKPTDGLTIPVPHKGPTILMAWRTLNGSSTMTVYQELVNPKEFRDREATFSCWIWCAEASSGRISIDDGVGVSYSSYHTGNSQWQYLTVTRTINKKAEVVKATLNIDGDEYYPVFFDDTLLTCPASMPNSEIATAYEIIEDLVAAIGGSVIVENASDTIFDLHPKMEIPTGATASSVLQQLIALLPDRIKWYGNDAYIYLPQTTDDPVYYFTGPEES